MTETTESTKFDWAKDIKIEVPLNEFMKMKKKIGKLQNKIKVLENEVSDERHKKWMKDDELQAKQKAYDALKADYQKLLGIDSEEGKQE